MAGFNLPPLDAPIPTSTKPSPKPEVKGFGRETLIPIEVEDRIFDELDSTKKDNSKVDIDDIFSDLDFPASQQANPKQSTPSVAPAFKPPALGEDVDDLEDLEDIEEEDGLGLYDLKSGPTSAALGGEEDDLEDIEDLDDEDLDDEDDESLESEDVEEETAPEGWGSVKTVYGIAETVRVNKANELTAFKLRLDDTGELIFLQEDQMNPILKGEHVVAEIDESSLTENKNGIKTYNAISVIPTSLLSEEPVNNVYDEESGSPEPPANPKGLRGIIQAIKDEYATKGSLTNDSDENDDPDEDEDPPVESKKRLPKKAKSSEPKGFYMTVADLIYNVLMSGINFLSKIPLIGKAFGLLKILDGPIRLLSKLWLLILIAVILLTTGLTSKIMGKAKGEQLSKDNVTLAITRKAVYENGKVNIVVKNESKVYADFFLTTKVRKGLPLIGKATTCESELTVLNLGEEKELTLICEEIVPGADAKGTDIQLNN